MKILMSGEQGQTPKPMRRLNHFRDLASERREITSHRVPSTASVDGSEQAIGITQERPPVLIMNLFYTGMGIARDLSRTGVRIIGLSAHRNGAGNHTRLCEVRRSPNSQEQPELLADFLLEAAAELRGAVIFPTRDFDVLFLDRYRGMLGPHYRLAIPPRASLFKVLNKYALACTARDAGVAAPHSMIVRKPEDLDRAAKEVGFPCVIKPVSSHQWREGANWEKVGGRKAFLIDSRETLGREYAQVSRAHHELLVQEWIPGKAEEIVVLGGYVGASSELLAYFTARKIIQSPDEYFGTGCVVRSEDIPALFEPTRKLLQALDYRGMAEVEYKFDARTREFKLIEMNARHWDQHELGRASGVNLSWTAYTDLTGHPSSFRKEPNLQTTWIAEDPLIRHVLRGLYRRDIKLRALYQQVSPPRIYGTFSWRDPWPFAYCLCTQMIPALGKSFLRNLKKRP
jgi:D-aspartate ligase